MKHGGFTLIEFIVILSIFAIMAGVALVNFQGFRNSVGVNNLTHDIALTIRQAQVFGWSTTSTNGSGGGIVLDAQTGNPTRTMQGIHFGYTNGVFDRSFILYSKINTNNPGYYENGDTIVDTIQIQGPNHIADIRTADTASALAIDANHHIPTTGNSVAGDLSIVFSRPRPEAVFFNGMTALTDVTSGVLGIYITADTSATNDPLHADHVIIVSRFGEIEVQ